LIKFRDIDDDGSKCLIHDTPVALESLKNIPELESIVKKCCWSYISK